jgi:hypothetical protein
MDKEELKKIFHLLFNKINNICIAAASNKELFKKESLGKISTEELKQRADIVPGVLNKIEENARLLNTELEGLYESLIGKSES